MRKFQSFNMKIVSLNLIKQLPAEQARADYLAKLEEANKEGI